jgi:hypothetical protein
LIARKLAVDNFGMNDDLSHDTVKQLTVVGLVFALLNSSLNQTILYWNGLNHIFLKGTMVM